MDQNINEPAPIVSVILPVHNGGKFLRDAIRSVLDQSYPDFELILIDDGSTDMSAKIISGFLDKRIAVIRNEANEGLIACLNKGIETSRGKYIARMDADDRCHPSRFEMQVSFMEADPSLGLCGTDYYSFSEDFFIERITLKGADVLKTWLLFSPPVCHPSVMIRREVLISNDLRFDSEFKYVEDYELWTRLVHLAGMDNIGKFLLYYRDHEGQVTHIKREEQIFHSKIVQRNYLSRLGFEFSDAELTVHNFASSGRRISDEKLLDEIARWLLSLVVQNGHKKIIPTGPFNLAIARMFFDCCGNTTLGLKAFRKWKTSPLSNFYHATPKMRLRLLAKCLVRKFR